MARVERVNGLDAWDLHDHFTGLRAYEIGGGHYYFDQRTAERDPFLSKMTIYDCVPYEDAVNDSTSPPDFDVVIGSHDYNFGLSYGWPGSTFHQHCSWTVNGGRLDLTESDWHHEYSPGCHRQFSNVEEVRRDTEKELAELFARLERYKQTGWYQLQWPEVAGLMANIYRQWMDADELRAQFWSDKPTDSMWQTEPTGRRGGAIGFELNDRGWMKTPLRLEMPPGISSGWQLNVFAPYSSPGDCPWYEGIVFRSEHSNAEDMEVQCPLPHSAPHRMRPTVINPWDVWQYLLRECLPKVAEDAQWQWSLPSLGW